MMAAEILFILLTIVSLIFLVLAIAFITYMVGSDYPNSFKASKDRASATNRIKRNTK